MLNHKCTNHKLRVLQDYYMITTSMIHHLHKTMAHINTTILCTTLLTCPLLIFSLSLHKLYLTIELLAAAKEAWKLKS